jgi:type II secretory pathway component GspD/PulD (secretin)
MKRNFKSRTTTASAMKKIVSNLLLAGLASVLIAHAQTNAVVPSQPVDNTNAATADTAITNSVAPVVVPALAPDTNTTATVTTNTTIAATVTTNTTLAAIGATATNAPAVENIPLIQFSDVPITTAIEHLARQAGINYMLDPKIGYGQPDQTGQIKAEPQLSIRWENITAESALLALLDNYGLQLVVDKKTGIDRVTAKDPLAPPPLITRVVQLQYASVSNMTAAVQSILSDKRSRVLADTRTSQMLVVAPDSEQQSVDTLVAELDKPTKQVLIETKLVQISSNPTAKRGVDWSSTLQSQHVTFGNGNVTGDTTTKTPGPSFTTTTPKTDDGRGGVTTTHTSAFGHTTVLDQLLGGSGWSASTIGGLIPATAFLNADGLSAVISFINASYDAQIVSTPRVVTLDNEPARIEVTRGFPVISLSGSSANSASSASVTYSNVGTILMVTPHISANEKIWLRVVPEVSSHFGDVTYTVPGGGSGSSGQVSVPVFDYRRIDSQVVIPNGNTLVMGGLVQDSPTATYSKVPFLGDVPGLGWAFHSESKSMQKDNLIIFMTPTIVKDADYQPTSTSFLQSRPQTMRSPMNPHKVWDGAEPESGWSNPAPIPGEFGSRKPTQ